MDPSGPTESAPAADVPTDPPGPPARGLPIPPENLRFMGESEERFGEIAALLADLVLEWVGPGAAVLDVGSGYGRLAIGLMERGFDGRYEGFDILPRHVAWCREHLTSIARDYRFHHLDVRNDRYNPNGRLDPASARFPGTGPFDAVAVFSVFTHMERGSIAHYLREAERLLRPGGVVIATFFLWDEARLPAVTSAGSHFPMVHEIDAYSRYSSADDPLFAIAHHSLVVRGIAEGAGLDVVETRPGKWDGSDRTQYQDLVILRRPEGAAVAGKPGVTRRLRRSVVAGAALARRTAARARRQVRGRRRSR